MVGRDYDAFVGCSRLCSRIFPLWKHCGCQEHGQHTSVQCFRSLANDPPHQTSEVGRELPHSRHFKVFILKTSIIEITDTITWLP